MGCAMALLAGLVAGALAIVGVMIWLAWDDGDDELDRGRPAPTWDEDWNGRRDE